MKRRAERIDSVVRSIIEKLDKGSNPTSDDIEEMWREVAGKEASSHTKLASLKKKRLVINVDSSGWLYELTLRRNELIAELKKRIGKEKLEKLQFRIGEFD